jgi:hypothetical protein
MTEKQTVGRPKGKSRKTSDAQRIRAILNQYGLTYPTSKVKAVLSSRNKIAKPENRVNVEAVAIDVKIAQVRSKLIQEVTGIVRTQPGRRTNVEMELVVTKLALAKEKEKEKAA